MGRYIVIVYMVITITPISGILFEKLQFIFNLFGQLYRIYRPNFESQLSFSLYLHSNCTVRAKTIYKSFLVRVSEFA